MKKSFLVVAILAALVISAAADIVPTVNSGVNLNGSNQDLSYTVSGSQTTATPVSPGTTSFASKADASAPIPPWIANGPNSYWIAPNPDTGRVGSPDGYYTYQTTFDLTGYNPTTASLTGKWSTDNNGIAIYLNGAQLLLNTADTSFTSWHSYVFNSGFVGGINTLQFVVYNEPYNCGQPTCVNPSGFRNEYTVTADPAATADPTAPAVPEPASLALVTSGLAVLWGKRRALKKK